MSYSELLIHEHYVMETIFQRVTTVQTIMLLKDLSVLLNMKLNHA